MSANMQSEDFLSAMEILFAAMSPISKEVRESRNFPDTAAGRYLRPEDQDQASKLVAPHARHIAHAWRNPKDVGLDAEIPFHEHFAQLKVRPKWTRMDFERAIRASTVPWHVAMAALVITGRVPVVMALAESLLAGDYDTLQALFDTRLIKHHLYVRNVEDLLILKLIDFYLTQEIYTTYRKDHVNHVACRKLIETIFGDMPSHYVPTRFPVTLYVLATKTYDGLSKWPSVEEAAANMFAAPEHIHPCIDYYYCETSDLVAGHGEREQFDSKQFGDGRGNDGRLTGSIAWIRKFRHMNASFRDLKPYSYRICDHIESVEKFFSNQMIKDFPMVICAPCSTTSSPGSSKTS